MEEKEMMEQETTMEPVEAYNGAIEEVDAESEGGRGGAVAIVFGSLAAVTAAAVFVAKKIKNKKADKPKKQKMRYKLVKVPVESDEEIDDVPETDYEEVDD